MSEGCAASGACDLDPLQAAAAAIELPMPHERKAVLRDEAAALLDRLLTSRARRRGAVEVAIGEHLAMLRVGDRSMRLGYAGVGD
jgi:hypothetical protein